MKNTESPIYKVWKNMRSRCNNPKNKKYSLYGGRGIFVDIRWCKFSNFQIDMEATYIKGLSLDRIDTNGPYSKENCRWSTQLVQQNNKRNNIVIEFGGTKKTLSEWARYRNIKITTLWMRIFQYHWSLEKALL